jgi:hypothetical protein
MRSVVALLVGFSSVAFACKRGEPSTHPAQSSDTSIAADPEPKPDTSAEPPSPPLCRAVDADLDETDLLAELDRLHQHLGYDAAPKSGRHRPCPEPCTYESDSRHKPTKFGGREPEYAPTELSDDESRLCGLYLRYADVGTDPDKARALRYRYVKLLTTHNRFEDVVPAVTAFLDEDIDDELASWAAEIHTDVLIVAWTSAADAKARTLHRDRLLAWLERSPDLRFWPRPDAKRLRESTRTLRAMLLIERGRASAEAEPPDHATCAQSYLAALEPSFGQAIDLLLYEAARCLEADGDDGGAKAAREQLLRRTPHSSYAQEVRAKLGK